MRRQTRVDNVIGVLSGAHQMGLVFAYIDLRIARSEYLMLLRSLCIIRWWSMRIMKWSMHHMEVV